MLGEKLQRLRKAQGLSQEDLAGWVGVSRQAVSKWETGESSPEIDKVIQISDCFHISTDYLLKDSADCKETNLKAEKVPNHKVKLMIWAAAFLSVGIALGLLFSRMTAKPSGDSADNLTLNFTQTENLVTGFSHSLAVSQPAGDLRAYLQFSVIPSVYADGMTATYMLVDSEGTVSVQTAGHGDGTAFPALMAVPLFKECTISIIFKSGEYEYTQPLLKAAVNDRSSYTWEELWQK